MISENRPNESSHGKRKQEHLNISLLEDVDFKDLTSGFDEYKFVHQALPETDLRGVRVSCKLLNKDLRAPIVISSMTGGITASARINRNLAEAAQALGLAMGVGSQRCMVDEPGTAPSYRVRDVAPDILLFANLGAVQLNYGYGIKECLRAVEDIRADALILHLNPLQEALQADGNTNFSGLLSKISRVCRELPVPVIVKEVGGGISEKVAGKLAGAGVSGIEASGAGGTCWTEIEKRRPGNKAKSGVAGAFSSWGIPTAQSLLMSRKGAPGLALIASGGIRTGVDVAKAIALGADAAGIAAPLLKAANVSEEAAQEYLEEIIETLRIAMFCIGVSTTEELKSTEFLLKLQGPNV
jgi:isopentenyl-diphosphate Delta-isomerase